MEQEKLLLATPGSTVSDAARLLESNDMGAIVVVENQSVVGIFTERDAVARVMALNRDPHTTRLAEVMTAAPLTIDPESSFGHALLLMHEHGFRHLPVVEDGRPIGIVRARDALDPEMEQFISEARRREGLR